MVPYQSCQQCTSTNNHNSNLEALHKKSYDEANDLVVF
jgi:hypothetical protein